jgi:hypothetical protein
LADHVISFKSKRKSWHWQLMANPHRVKAGTGAAAELDGGPQLLFASCCLDNYQTKRRAAVLSGCPP